jgi:hypothetical protein
MNLPLKGAFRGFKFVKFLFRKRVRLSIEIVSQRLILVTASLCREKTNYRESGSGEL